MSEQLPYELDEIRTGNGSVIINPGTGALTKQHSLDNARANMRQFIQDSALEGLTFRRASKRDYSNGRYAFLVRWGNNPRVIEIQMPGYPLEQVRYVSSEQDIWQFPRLYVDGSSWVWKYAVLDKDSFGADDES